MTAAQHYKSYVADDTFSPLSAMLISEILRDNPMHVLDFGSGSGKHSNALNKKGIVTLAIDLSMMNVIRAHAKYDLPFIACADESYLGHLCKIDVVTTCSVLDHIENIDNILKQFKRIANKSIIIAETNDIPGEYYYPHDYESYGFKKVSERIEITCKDNNGSKTYVPGDVFSWQSTGDGATYHIWKWTKEIQIPFFNDDLG